MYTFESRIVVAFVSSDVYGVYQPCDKVNLGSYFPVLLFDCNTVVVAPSWYFFCLVTLVLAQVQSNAKKPGRKHGKTPRVK